MKYLKTGGNHFLVALLKRKTGNRLYKKVLRLFNKQEIVLGYKMQVRKRDLVFF